MTPVMFECPFVNYLGQGVKATDDYACVLMREAGTNIPKTGKLFKFFAGNQLLATLSVFGRLEIQPDYACDGYSPTRKTFIGWLSPTPRPKKAGMFPAIGHDLTRQFLHVAGCPWTLEESDIWFREWLIAGGESRWIADRYYSVVAGRIGSLWHKWFHKHDPTLRIEIY